MYWISLWFEEWGMTEWPPRGHGFQTHVFYIVSSSLDFLIQNTFLKYICFSWQMSRKSEDFVAVFEKIKVNSTELNQALL